MGPPARFAHLCTSTQPAAPSTLSAHTTPESEEESTPHMRSRADNPNAAKQRRFRARQTVEKATKAAALKSAQARVQELEAQIERNWLQLGARAQFDADAVTGTGWGYLPGFKIAYKAKTSLSTHDPLQLIAALGLHSVFQRFRGIVVTRPEQERARFLPGGDLSPIQNRTISPGTATAFRTNLGPHTLVPATKMVSMPSALTKRLFFSLSPLGNSAAPPPSAQARSTLLDALDNPFGGRTSSPYINDLPAKSATVPSASFPVFHPDPTLHCTIDLMTTPVFFAATGPSVFALHTEEVGFASVNTLLAGQTKTWAVFSPRDTIRLEEHYRGEYTPLSGSEHMRH
ncbi:hypothetical protein Rhopal_007732-T1 [Rhodotorula paludigena]|uniref:BZIP domain-containing protein n=1 Tax=Rhodotorula paludigena TaxID=86838 RepID=A0AAV5GXG3_9BASI|nr:hypothetical protein Rhopal_007732-T1 [Rhodotorula paludigena]